MSFNREQNTFRTFGRAKGRSLTPAVQALWDEHFPRLKWDIQAELPVSPLWLEVGFGGAEHVLWQAENNPDVHIVGAEPFLNGVAKAVRGAADGQLKNLSLHHGDVRDLMSALPDAALDRIFVLFPDPWPKSRHHKRRLLRSEFIAEIYRVLKPGGEFRFGSDIIHYVDWTLTRLKRHGGFDFIPEQQGDWRVRPADWPETRYQQKALREGRTCHYFIFKRNDHET